MANPLLQRYLAADRTQRTRVFLPDAARDADADPHVSRVAAGSAP
jgi:hypothetical protein